METEITRSPERCPTHPGVLLREIVLPAVARPKTEIARALGISRQTLYDILNERQPVTAQMAVRFAKLLGRSPEAWLRMQIAHDLWHAERQVDTSRIPTLAEVEG